MDRRSLLKLSAVLGTSLVMPNFVEQVRAKQVAVAENVELLTVSDGNLRLPLSFIFPDVPREELEKVLADTIVGDGFVEPGLNLTLLREGDRRILFDAGSGPNFMPSAGKLLENLDAIGMSPEDITDVVFTHAHPDHLWGILDDFDEVLFPEAVLHVPRKEFEYWTDETTVTRTPEARKVFAVGAKNRFEMIEAQVQLFDAGSEVLPGVESFDTSGHTPGHTAFVIHATDAPIMVIGDALTNHKISFEKPDWPSGSDSDPEKGINTRKMLLDRLAAEKMQIIGYHLPNDGVGRVEKSGAAYKFIAS